jgi:hypothetical protein
VLYVFRSSLNPATIKALILFFFIKIGFPFLHHQ